MKALRKLVMERIEELSQEALKIHNDLEVWKKEPLDAIQRTILSGQLEGCLRKQKEWCQAISEMEEDEPNP